MLNLPSDCHTHHLSTDGLISIHIQDLAAKQLLQNSSLHFSIGFHPWYINKETIEQDFLTLQSLAHLPQVKAIGECGLDKLKYSLSLTEQILLFKRQIILAEQIKKPLIIHCVKAFDLILSLQKKYKPSQPWIIHGFRGKPNLGKQLWNKNIYTSFGESFNAETLRLCPSKYYLQETDTSTLSIKEIQTLHQSIRNS